MTSHGYKQNEISEELSMGPKSSKQFIKQFYKHFRLRK